MSTCGSNWQPDGGCWYGAAISAMTAECRLILSGNADVRDAS